MRAPLTAAWSRFGQSMVALGKTPERYILRTRPVKTRVTDDGSAKKKGVRTLGEESSDKPRSRSDQETTQCLGQPHPSYHTYFAFP
jgi:hypothetical protein